MTPEPAFVAGDGSFFGYAFLAGTPLLDALDAWTDRTRRESLVRLIVDVAVGIEAVVSNADAARMGLRVFTTPRRPPYRRRRGSWHAADIGECARRG